MDADQASAFWEKLRELEIGQTKIQGLIEGSLSQIAAIERREIEHWIELVGPYGEGGRLGSIYTRVDNAERRVHTRIDESNTRITSLEKWLWRMGGAGAVILFLFRTLKW